MNGNSHYCHIKCLHTFLHALKNYSFVPGMVSTTAFSHPFTWSFDPLYTQLSTNSKTKDLFSFKFSAMTSIYFRSSAARALKKSSLSFSFSASWLCVDYVDSVVVLLSILFLFFLSIILVRRQLILSVGSLADSHSLNRASLKDNGWGCLK